MIRIAALALLSVLLTGCVISLGDGDGVFRVNGVRLDQKHQETVLVGHWSEAGLRVESHCGDVRLEPTDGENRIVVTLHEKTPGDAYARFEDGVLVAGSRGDQQTAIGDVTVYTNGPIPCVDASTGCGDVLAEGVPVESDVTLSTGCGDVKLCCAGRPDKVVLSSGCGDVSLGNTICARLEISTGLGDVEVDEVSAKHVELSTGLGDVDVDACAFHHVEASTGLGDIDCDETTYEKGEFSTGLGSVDRD